MFCLTCNAEKHPSVNFTSKGIVEACPTCETVFARLDPDAPPVESVATPVRPVAPPPKPAATDALSIVDQVRARLAFCDEQIAAREGFIAEAGMLRKMLAAADGETRPTEAASVFTN